jgi:hypothetical protein
MLTILVYELEYGDKAIAGKSRLLRAGAQKKKKCE